MIDFQWQLGNCMLSRVVHCEVMRRRLAGSLTEPQHADIVVLRSDDGTLLRRLPQLIKLDERDRAILVQLRQ